MTSVSKYSRPKDSISGAGRIPGVNTFFPPPPLPLPRELRVWASSLASDLVFTIASRGRWEGLGDGSVGKVLVRHI